MIATDRITEIFYLIDGFRKEFEKVTHGPALRMDTGAKIRNRRSRLSDSEVMTIMVLFHYRQFRNLKHFYLYYVRVHMKGEFPQTVSYDRFVELQQKVVPPMAIFLKTCCLGRCTGVPFIGSTPLRACHIKREKQHRAFEGMAAKGQCSIGRFFGLKLHSTINDRGEVLDFMLAQGNVDDREPLKSLDFHKRVFGKIYGDKGYIGKGLFEQLLVDGAHLVTKIGKNMKNCLMLLQDRIMLGKRASVETVNDELENQCQVEHTGHRSFENFVADLLPGLVACSFFDKKPSLNLEIIDERLVA